MIVAIILLVVILAVVFSALFWAAIQDGKDNDKHMGH